MSVYLFGPLCTIPTPGVVATLISVEKYSVCWPLIPRIELDASSVDFPYHDDDGLKVSTKVLMHKRRVGGSTLEGKEPVQVCTVCHDGFRPQIRVFQSSRSRIVIGSVGIRPCLGMHQLDTNYF